MSPTVMPGTICFPRKLAAEATRDILNAMEQHDEAVRRRAEEDLARASACQGP